MAERPDRNSNSRRTVLRAGMGAAAAAFATPRARAEGPALPSDPEWSPSHEQESAWREMVIQ